MSVRRNSANTNKKSSASISVQVQGRGRSGPVAICGLEDERVKWKHMYTGTCRSRSLEKPIPPETTVV